LALHEKLLIFSYAKKDRRVDNKETFREKQKQTRLKFWKIENRVSWESRISVIMSWFMSCSEGAMKPFAFIPPFYRVEDVHQKVKTNNNLYK
jgi:hypothetical protein